MVLFFEKLLGQATYRRSNYYLEAKGANNKSIDPQRSADQKGKK
jgi:hypothetical protein